MELVKEGLSSPVKPISIKVSGDTGILPSEVTTTLAVVVTELLQNALAELSLISLNASLEINPQDPYAIAYKALVEAKIFEKMNSSKKYVEKFKALPNPPLELVELLRLEGLL